MSKVIFVNFSPEFFDELFLRIKSQGGVIKAEQYLIDQGYDKTVAKISVKRIMKTRGW